jgi:uncharacterized protein (DUF433 family)
MFENSGRKHTGPTSKVLVAEIKRPIYHECVMSTNHEYRYLEPRPGSFYLQPFIKGTRIRVEIPYGYTMDAEDEVEGLIPGYTPEYVADFLHIPVEAVHEAIDYCKNHWDVVIADHAREERLIEASGMNHPDYYSNPKKYSKILTVDEWSKITDDETLPG